jgi:hypothetical protein
MKGATDDDAITLINTWDSCLSSAEAAAASADENKNESDPRDVNVVNFPPPAMPPPLTATTIERHQSEPVADAAAWTGHNWSKSHNRSTGSLSSASDCSSGHSSVDIMDETHSALIVVPIPNTLMSFSNARRRGFSADNSGAGVPTMIRDFFPVAEGHPHEHDSDAESDDGSSDRRSSNYSSSALSIFQASTQRARSRRSLFFLFLIALYTTFGLTQPSLPVAEQLEFASSASPSSPLVSAELLHDDAQENYSGVNVKTLRAAASNVKTHSHVAFARRHAKALPVYRKKEVSDFYRQRAIVETQGDYWYLNCVVLIAVAGWAWRENRWRSQLSSTVC